MADNVVYLAIYKTEEMTVMIEYKPLENAYGLIGIEIISLDIQHKPKSQFQLRQEERKQSRRK